MRTLKTTVVSDVKARFRAVAALRGQTESELLRAMVLIVSNPEDSASTMAVLTPDDILTHRMTIRLPAFVKVAAADRAKRVGMTPSRWVAALVQSNATASPVFSAGELAALRAATRELAAVGRNINQIARALNEAFHETERVRLDTLAALGAAIDAQGAAIRALVRASQNAWAVGDGAD